MDTTCTAPPWAVLPSTGHNWYTPLAVLLRGGNNPVLQLNIPHPCCPLVDTTRSCAFLILGQCYPLVDTSLDCAPPSTGHCCPLMDTTRYCSLWSQACVAHWWTQLVLQPFTCWEVLLPAGHNPVLQSHHSPSSSVPLVIITGTVTAWAVVLPCGHNPVPHHPHSQAVLPP